MKFFRHFALLVVPMMLVACTSEPEAPATHRPFPRWQPMPLD